MGKIYGDKDQLLRLKINAHLHIFMALFGSSGTDL
jgi:hypothetical protein